MDEKIFLEKRRNRAIATILGFKDRECDKYLPPEVSDRLRKEVLDEINELVDVAFDLMDSTSDFNREYLSRIEQIHAAVVGE